MSISVIQKPVDITSTQTITGAKTAQNLTVTTNALTLTVGQIAFPASQNASAGANTLDDYEEGTFTPTVRGSGTAGSGTYTTQVGAYTKIGNVVYFSAYVVWTNITGSPTGNMQMASLPFTSRNTTNLYHAMALCHSNIALTAANTPSAYMDPNATTVNILQNPTGGGAQASVPVDTAGTLFIAGHYLV